MRLPTLRVRPVALVLCLVLAASGAGVVTSASSAADTGSISGVVTGPGGVPLDNVMAMPYVFVPGSAQNDQWRPMGTSYTDRTSADGSYDISGLAAGIYRIRYWDNAPTHYVTEYWGDAYFISDGDDVSVAAGQTTTGIDAELGEGGHITGRLTNPDGEPVPGITVVPNIWDRQGNLWHAYASSAITDANGYYDVPNLPTTTFRLHFQPGMNGSYETEFWDDAATVDTATDIPVVAGQTFPGHDAVLRRAGHIQGIVTGPDGQPLNGIQVVATYVDPATGRPDASTSQSGYGFSGPTGAYDVPVHGAGAYRVWFSDTTGATSYLLEYWPDAATIEDGENVVVGDQATVTGIDIQLSAATIETEPQVGAETEATAEPWTAGGLDVSYQWYVDGTAVRGATEPTYTPRPRDAGKALRVSVATKSSGQADDAMSAARAVTKARMHVVRKTRVVGDTVRHGTLRVRLGTWSAKRTHAQVRWFAGGTKLGHGRTLALEGRTLAKVGGKRIRARVTVTAQGYRPMVKVLKVGRIRGR